MQNKPRPNFGRGLFWSVCQRLLTSVKSAASVEVRLAEVESETHIEVCGGHIDRNRSALCNFETDEVGTEEEVESVGMQIQGESEYSETVVTQEGVAYRCR